MRDTSVPGQDNYHAEQQKQFTPETNSEQNQIESARLGESGFVLYSRWWVLLPLYTSRSIWDAQVLLSTVLAFTSVTEGLISRCFTVVRVEHCESVNAQRAKIVGALKL